MPHLDAVPSRASTPAPTVICKPGPPDWRVSSQELGVNRFLNEECHAASFDTAFSLLALSSELFLVPAVLTRSAVFMQLIVRASHTYATTRGSATP